MDKRIIKVQSAWRNKKSVCQIRLMGLWLKRAGFEQGDTVEITMQDGKLTIEKTNK